MPTVVAEIWSSFLCLPLWVQIWVGYLGTLNTLTLLFLSEPGGPMIAALSFAGMLTLITIAVVQRGISLAGSIPHVVFWTPQVVYIGWCLIYCESGDGAYRNFMIVLLITNVISLGFDVKDTLKWLRGERTVFRLKEKS